MARAFICACAGTRISAAEHRFFAEADPWGLILFARNCAEPEQLRALVCEFRSLVGRDQAPVLIDQEGGPVQRLRPPHWPDYPSAGALGRLFARDREAGREATWLTARLIAHDLAALGITVDCMPVLDVPVAGAHRVIGERAYGRDPETVATLGRAAADGLMVGGVLPVIKHIPGHGRARADSHRALPRVVTERAALVAADFVPFRALSDLPLAMTAHVVYEDIDPGQPATLSAAVIGETIRGEIGFEGALMSDDLSMGALSGSLGERTRAAIAAGCDLALHCNGTMAEMEQVAAEAPELAGESGRRVRAALTALTPPAAIEAAEARRKLARLVDESVSFES